jgi:nicotinamidase-related amidase
MPLTNLDPIAALVVIDMQKGVVAFPTAHPMPGVVSNVAQLAQGFRTRGLPVVLVNVAGRAPGRTDSTFNFSPPPDWTDLIPELDRKPTDHTLTKFQIGAFYGTSLELFLRRKGATQVVLAGVATSMGVEATARTAYDHGFNVVVAVDAMTDLDAEAHRNSVEKVFPRISQRASTAEVLKLLSGKP